MGHLSSWTTSDSIIKQLFSYRTGLSDECTHAAQVTLKCKSKTGVDISKISDINQSEVLFSKNASFTVKSVKETTVNDGIKVTKVEIELEEND